MFMDWLRKNRYTVFLITLGIFVIGIFGGLGSNYFGSGAKANVIAEVNDQEVSLDKFNRYLNRYLSDIEQRNPNQEITEAFVSQRRQEVLGDLIREEALYQESKAYGIVVTDQEVAVSLQNFAPFQKDGRFDAATYVSVLRRQLHSTPEEFEESRRRQMAISKLQHLISSIVQVTPQEASFEYSLRNKGKTDKFEKEKDSFVSTFGQEKVVWTFDQWSKKLSTKVKIKNYMDRFFEK